MENAWKRLHASFGKMKAKVNRWFETHKNFNEALIETVFVVVFSTIPIWLFPGFAPFVFKTNDGVIEQVLQNISQGELFLYSVAMLGPIFYATSYKYAEFQIDYGKLKVSMSINLPYGRILCMLSALLALFFGAIYGSIRLNDVAGAALEIDINGTIYTSLLAFSFSCFLFFVTCWVKNQLNAGGASIMRNDEQAFLDRYFGGKR